MKKIDRKNIISEIKERLQLSSIVSHDTKLVRKGAQYVGSCPLHHEKTASFFVNDNMGSYFCFGCRESGDVIQYIVKKRNVTFNQALEILAEMAGIEIDSVQDSSAKHRKLDMLNIASVFYNNQLMQSDRVLDYCRSRNIDKKSIDTFEIGYSGRFLDLCDVIKKSGYSQSEIKELGLEKFKNRLIFPIANKSGNVVGFGARTLDDNVMPKYINSNDSDIFHKQNILYGYHIASRNVNKSNGFVVVEGYVDVVAMHQYGFNTAIAAMGTSFGQKHLEQVWQYCDNCILCFDGDSAGIKASIRAAFLCVEHVQSGKNVSICRMPDGDDPASLLLRHGPDKMHEVLSGAKYLSNFIWDHYVDVYDGIAVKTPEAIAQWKEEIFGMISRIQNTSLQYLYKADFKERIYKLTNPRAGVNHYTRLDTKANSANIRLIHECILLYSLGVYRSLLDSFVEKLNDIQFMSDLTKRVCCAIIDGNIDPVDFAEVEGVAKRYHDFWLTDESNIEEFISTIFSSLAGDNYEVDCIEKSSKDMFLRSKDDNEWNRLKRLKKQKIKQ